MKIAALVFGLLIPTYAYYTAYPGGPHEMYNKIYAGWVDNNLPKNTQTFHLDEGFNVDTKPTYDYVNSQLLIAKSTDTAVIEIGDNRGGLGTMLTASIKAIQQTKATVIITVKRMGLSCGTFILGHGNYLKLPYDSILLFHMGSAGGYRITPYYPAGLPDELKPTWDKFVKESIEVMAPYRSWISKADYADYVQGRDLFYTGKDLCLKLRGTNAPVLYQTQNGCVIKGFKGNN